MANWLNFSKISDWAEWTGFGLSGFQYNEVTDADITSALANSSVIASIDTNLDWEDDEYLSETPDVSEDKKHAHRIAALVRELRVGGNIRNAVEIDTFCMDRCCSGVFNGHHRIRAMQFLGMECGPFSLSGSSLAATFGLVIASFHIPTGPLCGMILTVRIVAEKHSRRTGFYGRLRA